MRTLRFTTGGDTSSHRVTDADTGELIENVRSIKITAAHDELALALVEFCPVQVDGVCVNVAQNLIDAANEVALRSLNGMDVEGPALEELQAAAVQYLRAVRGAA